MWSAVAIPAPYTHLSVSIATAGADRLCCGGGPVRHSLGDGGRPACRGWRHLAAWSSARVSTGLANNSTFPGRGAFFRPAGRPALRQAGCPPLPQVRIRCRAIPRRAGATPLSDGVKPSKRPLRSQLVCSLGWWIDGRPEHRPAPVAGLRLNIGISLDFGFFPPRLPPLFFPDAFPGNPATVGRRTRVMKKLFIQIDGGWCL